MFVSEKINYGTFKKLAEKQLNKKFNIRIATQKFINQNSHDNFLNFINQNLQESLQQKQESEIIKILLIDEVDIFFNTDYYGKTYNPVATFKNTEIEFIIKDIWNKREQNTEEIIQSVKASDSYIQLIRQYPKFEQLFSNHIQTLSQDVKNIQKHQQDYDYVVKDYKIGYRQLDSSVSFTTYYGYKTLFSYFYQNTQGKIIDQSLSQNIKLHLNCGNISYALFPFSYQAILGVTGTLKSLNQQMKQCLKKYNIQNMIYIPSMFGDSKLQFNRGDMVFVENDLENQQLKIQEISSQAVIKGQSVLIFFKDSQSLNNYHESNYLYLQKDNYIVIKEHDSINDLDFNVQRVTQSGQIGLLLREYGRGTDFHCLDPKVNTAGGVVVIQTFFSNSIAEEIQIKGRTARQGQPGQFYIILNKQDIESQFQIKQDQISQWENNRFTKPLYEHLDKVRNDLEEKKYSDIEQHIQSSTQKHNDSMEFYENLQNSNEKAIQFINTYS
ncbi:hypothetical protein ABPG74_007764 [Tetrahymena malaccensis]